MNLILHICPRVMWFEAQQRCDYQTDSLDSEGFIHCSTPEQVVGTANFLFRGQRGLVLLVINSDRVTAPIRYEDAGNGQLFPHVFGSLNLDAVVGVQEFEPSADGSFTTPLVLIPEGDGP